MRDLKLTSKANAKTRDENVEHQTFFTQLVLSTLYVQRPAAKAKGKAKAKAKAKAKTSWRTTRALRRSVRFFELCRFERRSFVLRMEARASV